MEHPNPVNIQDIRKSMTLQNIGIGPEQRNQLVSEFNAWSTNGLQTATYLHDEKTMQQFLNEYMASHKIIGAKPSRIQYAVSLMGTVFLPFIEAAALRHLNRGDNNAFIAAADAAFGYQQTLMMPIITERYLGGQSYGPEELVGGIDSYLQLSTKIVPFTQSLEQDDSGVGVIRSYIGKLKAGNAPLKEFDKRIPEFVVMGAEAALDAFELIYPYTKGFKPTNPKR